MEQNSKFCYEKQFRYIFVTSNFISSIKSSEKQVATQNRMIRSLCLVSAVAVASAFSPAVPSIRGMSFRSLQCN